MATESRSDALVLASILLRKLDKCEDSRRKKWISGLLTLAATAAHLACDLADNDIPDTIEELKHVQEELVHGAAPIEAAFKEVLAPRENVPAGGSSDCAPDQSTKAAHPTEATDTLDHSSATPPEMPDMLSPERMIELITGHVHDRLEKTFLDTIIEPLASALLQPLLTSLQQPLLDSLLIHLRGTLAQDSVLFESLSTALYEPLSKRVLDSLSSQRNSPSSDVLGIAPGSAAAGAQLSPPGTTSFAARRPSHPLDPIATALSGFKRRGTTPSEPVKKRLSSDHP